MDQRIVDHLLDYLYRNHRDPETAGAVIGTLIWFAGLALPLNWTGSTLNLSSRGVGLPVFILSLFRSAGYYNILWVQPLNTVALCEGRRRTIEQFFFPSADFPTPPAPLFSDWRTDTKQAGNINDEVEHNNGCLDEARPLLRNIDIPTLWLCQSSYIYWALCWEVRKSTVGQTSCR